MKTFDQLREGFVSAAQRRAVWASKADGGKGHPDNKKKKEDVDEVKSADKKPEKYTDANGRVKTRMVPVVKEQDEVNELDTSTLVSYRKKANKQRYSNDVSKRPQRTKGVDRADKKLAKRGVDKFGNKHESVNEEMMFKVNVEGLPPMIMLGKSPGDIKGQLRKIVKQPSMIGDIDRMTKAEVKKRYRDMGAGKEDKE